MRFNKRARLDTSQIRDRRGRGGGFGRGGGIGGGFGGSGGIGMGRSMGGIGGVGGVILLLVVLFGGGGGGLFSTGTTGGSGTAAPAGGELESCQDVAQDRECRFVAIENSLQDHWAAELEALGRPYQPATLTVFEGGVSTGCGQATSQVGPFYCPADAGVYLDLGFFDELQTTFGAVGGEFAEAYIIAHELGHHVQNLTGQNDLVQTREGPESDAVRLELQADCYAGVWAGDTDQGGDPLIADISDEDIVAAVDAAERVGDDYIQERFGNGVNPESWTHGSSEQRRRWFEVGYASGDPRSCDTFSAAEL